MPVGCEKQRCAEDSDLTGLLTLMMKCNFFNKVIKNDPLILNIKDFRNKVMHSGTLKIGRQEMIDGMNNMIALLEDQRYFYLVEACKDAVEKIKQLRNYPIDMVLFAENERRALTYRVNIIKDQIEQLQFESGASQSRIQDLVKKQESSSTQYEELQRESENIKLSVDQLMHQCSDMKKIVKIIDIPGVISDISSIFSKLDSLAVDTKHDIQRLDDIIRHVTSRMDKTENRLNIVEEQVKHVLSKAETEDKPKPKNEAYIVQTKSDTEIKELRQHFLSMYRKHCKNISFSPLRPNIKRPIREMYVQQALRVIDHRGERGHTNSWEKSDKQSDKQPSMGSNKHLDKTVTNIKDIFYSKGNLCKNIYVTAEAGVGKTTFCNHLVSLWCSAHDENDENENQMDDLKVMKEFSLLFYINLNGVHFEHKRTKTDQYASLIEEQWELPFSVKEFLVSENCLIVADALDECPQGLPYKGKLNNCTVLITSRPWKIETLRIEIEGGNIDLELELMSLCEKNYKELSDRIINVLASESISSVKRKCVGFISEMKRNGLRAFLEIPVLLIQMLCLWYDGRTIGKSQVEIYLNIVHHQLDVREFKQNMSNPIYSNSRFTSPFACSFEKCICKQHEPLLWRVAKFAFDTLFNKDDDISLTFEHRENEYNGLSEEDLQICLESGILTQEKVLGQFTILKKVIRFMHKSHHDFFAGVYLSSFDDMLQLSADLNRVMSNLDDALKLDKVLMFVSGMNPNVALNIASFILEKASNDSRIHAYRSSFSHWKLVQKVQNIIIQAEEEYRESSCKQVINFCVDDIIIDYVNVYRVVPSLSHMSLSNIVSLRLASELYDTYFQTDRAMSSIPVGARIQHIYLSFCSIGGLIENVQFGNLITDSLCVLYMCGIRISHDDLAYLSHRLAMSKNLKKVRLSEIKCKTHYRSLLFEECGAYKIDLSNHRKMEEFVAWDCEIPSCFLSASMENLQRVELRYVIMTSDCLFKLYISLPDTSASITLDNVVLNHVAGQIAPDTVLDDIRYHYLVLKDEVLGFISTALLVTLFDFIKQTR